MVWTRDEDGVLRAKGKRKIRHGGNSGRSVAAVVVREDVLFNRMKPMTADWRWVRRAGFATVTTDRRSMVHGQVLWMQIGRSKVLLVESDPRDGCVRCRFHCSIIDDPNVRRSMGLISFTCRRHQLLPDESTEVFFESARDASRGVVKKVPTRERASS